MSRTQSIGGTGTPTVGEAGAIGSPKIQESKAKERREEEERNSSLRAVLYSPCGSRVAYRPSVSARYGL